MAGRCCTGDGEPWKVLPPSPYFIHPNQIGSFHTLQRQLPEQILPCTLCATSELKQILPDPPSHLQCTVNVTIRWRIKCRAVPHLCLKLPGHHTLSYGHT